MNPIVVIVVVTIVLVLVIFALSGVRVVQQYERGVIFILGRLTGAKGPGLFWVPPIITHMVKVDLRIVTLTVPPQDVITRDNVTIKVAAVIYYYVVDPSCSRCQCGELWPGNDADRPDNAAQRSWPVGTG